MTTVPMRLAELARAAGAILDGPDGNVTGITIDSRLVQPGHLFVALAGARYDGSAYFAEARRRGAVAICATEPVPGVATIVAADTRRALSQLAAAFFGDPAREMTLIGITGSIGKTSCTHLLERILAVAGTDVGVIGSLGIRYGSTMAETGMTTPEAPAIHGALRAMRDGGVTTAIMEVTTHSILFHRVAELDFALGIITNLVSDEHLELHPTPEHYLQTKTRFFGMLRSGAPLIFNADDRTVFAATRDLGCPLVAVSAADGDDADVVVAGLRLTPTGSVFTLRVAHPLPRLDGGAVAPLTLDISLRVPGPHLAANAALAATAALVAGVSPEAVARGLARSTAMRRRMEIVHHAGPVILDDTVGNPASIDAVFETTRAMPHERLHVVYAIRGARGVPINEHTALAIAARIGLRQGSVTEHPGRQPPRLIVTASEDATDDRNRVADAERDAVLAILRDADVAFEYERELEPAVRRALDACGPSDLLLLLGAQGMDRGAAIARDALGIGVRG